MFMTSGSRIDNTLEISKNDLIMTAGDSSPWNGNACDTLTQVACFRPDVFFAST